MLTLPKKKSQDVPKKAKKAPRKNASKAKNTSTVEEMTPSEPPTGEITPEIQVAQNAVEQFNLMRDEYNAMWDQFKGDYPEAYELYAAIEDTRSEIQGHIEETKGYIKEAKVSIGEFICTLKSTNPKYDPDKMLGIVSKTMQCAAESGDWLSDEVGAALNGSVELDASTMMDHINTIRKQIGMFNELIRAKAVKGLSLDQAVMKVLMPRNIDISSVYNDAYDKGGVPMTPAVEIPKI